MVKKFSEVVQNIREVKEPTGKLKDACWKGYTAVGMKNKNGRKVPNCVPVKEENNPYVAVHAKKGKHETHGSTSYEAAQNAAKHWKMKNTSGISVYRADKTHSTQHVGEQFASDKPEPTREPVEGRFTSHPAKTVTKPAPQATPKNEEVEQIEEMPGANMDTRAVHKHLRKSGWSLTRTKGSHDVYTHPKSEKHIAVPRHKQLKAPLVRGIMKDAHVSEDIEQVEESRGHKILATKLAQIAANHRRAAEAAKREAEEQKKKEPVKEEYKKGDLVSIKSHGPYMDSRNTKGVIHSDLLHGDGTSDSRGTQVPKGAYHKVKTPMGVFHIPVKNISKQEHVKEEKKGSWQKDTGWKKDKGDAVDKSGAKHSAMSRAKHLAKMASRKKVLEQDNNNQVDNVQTPAKKSLAFRGVVKNVEKPTKGKKLSGDDKFEPEPELNTQIMRNNF